MVVTSDPLTGSLTLLAVRIPTQEFVRAECSFRTLDGGVSVTVDGVEVVQFDEGFCIGSSQETEECEGGMREVRMFVHGGGKGGSITGCFVWDRGTWIEQLESEIDGCIRERRGKEEGNRLMREVREGVERAERRGGVLGREEVKTLLEMGERLGAREVSLKEEVLNIVARIKRKGKGKAAGELLVKIRGMEEKEVREEVVRAGVMKSLLRCVKNDGSGAFRENRTEEKDGIGVSQAGTYLLTCIVLCVSGIEVYEDVRGLGGEMEEVSIERGAVEATEGWSEATVVCQPQPL